MTVATADEFSPQEREFLMDVVNWWLDGMDDATNDVANDYSIPDAETYVNLLAGMADQKETALAVKAKLDRGKLEG